jgi:hypothetical protein
MAYTNKRGTPYSASGVKSKVEVPTILDTASGAATAAGVSQSAIYRAIKSGRLPACKLNGGSYVIYPMA